MNCFEKLHKIKEDVNIEKYRLEAEKSAAEYKEKYSKIEERFKDYLTKKMPYLEKVALTGENRAWFYTLTSEDSTYYNWDKSVSLDTTFNPSPVRYLYKILKTEGFENCVIEYDKETRVNKLQIYF